MSTTYDDYTAALQNLAKIPDLLVAERAAAERDASKAREIAAASPQEARRLLDYTNKQVDNYLTGARDLLAAIGLAAVIPRTVRATPTSGEPSRSDVAQAEQRVRDAHEALRLAVLAHREDERREAEAHRLAAEAESERARQRELARREAEGRHAEAAARRRKRNQILIGVGALLSIVLVAVLVLL